VLFADNEIIAGRARPSIQQQQQQQQQRDSTSVAAALIHV